MDRVVALIVDEGKWLTLSMGLALLAVSVLSYRHRDAALPARRRIAAIMNLFFGVTIGTMAFGHLLAVSTKLAMGTLRGSTVLFYAIGLILAAPSWSLVRHARGLFTSHDDHNRMTMILNTWVAGSLLILGIPNFPLALPGFFNIGYELTSHRVAGWAIVSLAVVLNLGLFFGSLVFLLSGQSFEQFSGIE